MDVQTLAVAPAYANAPDPFDPQPVPAPAPAAPAAAASADPQSPGTNSDGPKHGLPAFQLPHDVARVFTGGAASNVSVSFKVEHGPNEIVTVFKNNQTGEEITQVPSEIMIKIAEFFDQVAGVILDKTA